MREADPLDRGPLSPHLAYKAEALDPPDRAAGEMERSR